MKVLGIIPARYQSSRFPGKPLAQIAGIPMIIRVARKVEEALGRENTFVATDDERIASVVESYGYNYLMTSSDCKTGTDRLVEFARQIEADFYINIQGDEPVIEPGDILRILEAKKNNPASIINGMRSLLPGEDPGSVNIPKVVAASNGKLIYMSRLPIPAIKNAKDGIPDYKKQICIYAFNREELEVYGSYTDKATVEMFEDIEILRFLDAGREVLMVETQGNSVAVDSPEDILAVEKILSGN